jgi:flagellin
LGSNASISELDISIDRINTERAGIGAVVNRLNYAVDNLTNVAQNTTESRSRILDADYAKASSELARTQIISQAATAMLAQANQQPQTVMKLLQG